MVNNIRALPQPRCMLCGGEGRALYAGLRDRLFSAPGEWSHRRCRKRSCALIWLDPMPVPEDIGQAYSSYYTHAGDPVRIGLAQRFLAACKSGYLADRFGYVRGVGFCERIAGFLPRLYPGRAAELDFAVMWLPASRRGRLLDIGSGSGWLMRQMQALGWEVEGLDFDSVVVARAREQGLTVHLGGLAEQQLPAERYDAITMSHSIEHVHEPGRWLAECRRILKPGGVLVVATPNSGSLGHRIFHDAWFCLDPPRHLHLFNRANLARLVAEAGLDIRRAFTSVRDANGMFLASRAIGRTGRFDMMAPRSALAKLWGRAFQAVEMLVHAVSPGCGEDLVVIAEKPPRA